MNRRPEPFDDTTQKDVLLWARAYSIAAVTAAVLLLVVIGGAIGDARQTTAVIEPERINPNTASMGSLVRLPGIGKARALDIIHYRQVNAAGVAVFNTPDDLQAIRGIGPKTAENIAPWLTFENE